VTLRKQKHQYQPEMPMMAEDFVNVMSCKNGLIMSLERHYLQIPLQVLSEVVIHMHCIEKI
jgi:hypothetical protein